MKSFTTEDTEGTEFGEEKNEDYRRGNRGERRQRRVRGGVEIPSKFRASLRREERPSEW